MMVAMDHLNLKQILHLLQAANALTVSMRQDHVEKVALLSQLHRVAQQVASAVQVKVNRR